MGQKHLALLEKWLKYGPLHSGHVKLYCVWPIQVHTRLNPAIAHACIMERAVEMLTLLTVNAVIEAKVVRWLSTLLSKQWSHIAIKAKERRIWQRGKKKDSVNENTHHWALSIWLLLTVCLCIAYYWLGAGKRGCITHYAGDRFFGKSNVLLVLTVISGLYLSGRNVEVTA